MPDQTVNDAEDQLSGNSPVGQGQVPPAGTQPTGATSPADISSQTPTPVQQGGDLTDTGGSQPSNAASPVSPPPVDPGADPALNTLGAQGGQGSSEPQSMPEPKSAMAGDKPAEDQSNEKDKEKSDIQPSAQSANIPPVSDIVTPPTEPQQTNQTGVDEPSTTSMPDDASTEQGVMGGAPTQPQQTQPIEPPTPVQDQASSTQTTGITDQPTTDMADTPDEGGLKKNMSP